MNSFQQIFWTPGPAIGTIEVNTVNCWGPPSVPETRELRLRSGILA